MKELFQDIHIDSIMTFLRQTRAAVDGTPSQIPAFLSITFTLGSRSHKM